MIKITVQRDRICHDPFFRIIGMGLQTLVVSALVDPLDGHQHHRWQLVSVSPSLGYRHCGHPNLDLDGLLFAGISAFSGKRWGANRYA